MIEAIKPPMGVPLVSVVMAIFNGHRYLGSAIESILGQSFSEFEFIIVDDGSIDDSLSVASTYACQDSRIRIAQQKHEGLISALNRGCGLARGTYIARFDSDDIAFPKRLEEQVTYFEGNDIALLGGNIECIDSEGNEMSVIELHRWADGLKDLLMVNNYIAHTTVMMRKDAFLRSGGYRPQFQQAEDYDLFLRMSESYMIDNLPSLLCRYRLHDHQVSVESASQQIISSIGARLAAWARRANLPEPEWKNNLVTREALLSCGIKNEKIDLLISNHKMTGVNALTWKGR